MHTLPWRLIEHEARGTSDYFVVSPYPRRFYSDRGGRSKFGAGPAVTRLPIPLTFPSPSPLSPSAGDFSSACWVGNNGWISAARGGAAGVRRCTGSANGKWRALCRAAGGASPSFYARDGDTR